MGLLGSGPNQVSTNSDLGSMAFQDSAGVSVGQAEMGNFGMEYNGFVNNGVTYFGVEMNSDIGANTNTNFAMHRHSTTYEPSFITFRSNSDDYTHVNVTNNQYLTSIISTGTAGNDYKTFGAIRIMTDGNVQNTAITQTSAPGKFLIQITANNSITPSNVLSIINNGNMSLGGADANTYALLDVQSTTKGVRLPNMTTVQKTAIVPVAGLMVFDITLGKMCVANSTAWQTVTSV